MLWTSKPAYVNLNAAQTADTLLDVRCEASDLQPSCRLVCRLNCWWVLTFLTVVALKFYTASTHNCHIPMLFLTYTSQRIDGRVVHLSEPPAKSMFIGQIKSLSVAF